MRVHDVAETLQLILAAKKNKSMQCGFGLESVQFVFTCYCTSRSVALENMTRLKIRVENGKDKSFDRDDCEF